MHGGELVAATLEKHGVRYVFTLCGGHISPILTAAKARGIHVVDVRHEATAVFAADATSRLTGVPGVAVVTAGPGVTNTATAVENARLAQSPLVVLGGAAPTVLRGRGALQDIDQMALMRPRVKWARSVRRVVDLPAAVARAFHVAREGLPGPVFVDLPVDLLYPEAVVRDWYGAKVEGGAGLRSRVLGWALRRHLDRLFRGAGAASLAAPLAAAPATPDRVGVARARRLLERSRRPLLLVGSQAVGEPTRAEAVAAAVGELGVPTYVAGMARGLLGAEHVLLLRHGRRSALREADLVLLAGVPCDFRLDYGRQIPARTPVVAVNRSRRDLRLNRRPTVGAVADPGRFLTALAAAGSPGGGPRGEWLAELRERERRREEELAGVPADAGGEGVHPVELLRGLDRLLADDSVLVGDGGDFVATAAYTVRPRGPLLWLDPGPFGTLGVGAGFALAAKLARPDAEVWLLWGDGAAGYGLAEVDTFARHGLPVLCLIGNDASWQQIAREQVELLGDDVATRLASSDYEGVATALGGRGLRLERPGEMVSILEEARRLAAAGHPVVVNARLAPSDFRKGAISM